MNKREKIILALSITVILAVVVSLNLNLQGAQGAAPGGMLTMVATSSTIDATSASRVAFASSTDCTSRVITVPVGGGIRISFADLPGITLSATVGHIQAASTTVTYDAGLYGCGQLTVWGEGDLQVTEFRGFR